MSVSKTYIKIWRGAGHNEPIIASGVKEIQKDDIFQCVENLHGGPVMLAKTNPELVKGKWHIKNPEEVPF